jgi:tRNA(Arg) A34 adenosine deaminase TadA
MLEDDETYLRRAIEVAGRSRANGSLPFGAIFVDSAGAVVAEGENTVLNGGDCTGHAEMNLIREAWSTLGRAGLRECTAYVSAEPCAMCAAAFYWASVKRVVFALGGDAVRELTGVRETNPYLRVFCRDVLEQGRPRIPVSGPHIEDEARRVHEGFWTP